MVKTRANGSAKRNMYIEMLPQSLGSIWVVFCIRKHMFTESFIVVDISGRFLWSRVYNVRYIKSISRITN